MFALADTAFAFACNSYGDNTLAAAASIDFLAPARAGDTLTAARARALAGGPHPVSTKWTWSNQSGERIALFRGRISPHRRTHHRVGWKETA